jgi:hypothetical protein
MSKIAITGRFATTTDVIRVHRITPMRQAWLEEQLSEIEKPAKTATKRVASAKTLRVTSRKKRHSTTTHEAVKKSSAKKR